MTDDTPGRVTALVSSVTTGLVGPIPGEPGSLAELRADAGPKRTRRCGSGAVLDDPAPVAGYPDSGAVRLTELRTAVLALGENERSLTCRKACALEIVPSRTAATP